ncbi:MAG: toxin-antitoxin system YwqK family antitoxin [Bacteroidia bacterium]|nr:toxin-antitoxin system YwqK family antitoxin [Bacteroidia bacterium]
MKKLVLLFLFVICKVSFAQSGKDSVNVTDADGKRQGRWVVTNKLMKPPLVGYTEDQKVEEGRYVDSKKIGIWVAYYANGKMKNRITFEGGRPFGKAIMYHENGKVAEEGLWRNNRWVGDYKLYYENGEVQHEFKFNSGGKREGNQKYFAENGQLIIEGEMKDSKEIGTWKEFYENGDLKAEKAFNDGTIDPVNTKTYEPKKPVEPKKEDASVKEEEPKSPAAVKVDATEKPNEGAVKNTKPFTGEGYAKLFRPDRQISKDGEFHKFRLIDGKTYIYNNNGILERIAVYQNGKYIGDAPLPVE